MGKKSLKNMYFCKNKENPSGGMNRLVIRRIKYRLQQLSSALLMAAGMLVTPLAMGQRTAEPGAVVRDLGGGILELTLTVGDLSFESLPEGALLHAQGLEGWSHNPDGVQLPRYQRLMTLPEGCRLQVRMTEDRCEEHTLRSLGCVVPLRGAPGARVKNPEREEQTSEDLSLMERDHQPELVTLEYLGTLRHRQLVRLSVSPFAYRADGQRLVLHRSVRLELTLAGSDKSWEEIENPWDNWQSPWLEEGIQKYQIVAPESYRETLQPFVAHKRRQGFLVREHYFLQGDKDTLRAFLRRTYEEATPDDPAPLYVLLVGDADQLPLFLAEHQVSGMERHYTDLYYGEYTGDYLPDALVGRLPAGDTATLRHVLEKSMAYEHGEYGDSAALRRMLLVAGKEDRDPAPTATNGQVNYLKQLLLSHDPNLDTHCFYNPASATQDDSIRRLIGEGVGLVNYTAHCFSWGWHEPRLNLQDIDSIGSNGNRYLSVNNCCKSNAVIGDCFGEHLLCNGDAIGVIGASNETLWDEDYYWSVGFRAPLSANPGYDSSHLGTFDRLLHSHGESVSHRALTQGMMVAAGNSAVSESGSPYDAFYWEIYGLLGDPSLMPYVGIPEPTTLSVSTPQRGDRLIALQGTPYARVALLTGDSVIGATTLSADGFGTLVSRLPLTDSVTLTASAQYHTPATLGLLPIHYPGARLAVTALTLLDGTDTVTRLDACSDRQLCITLRNVGDSALAGGTLRIATDSALTLNDTLFTIDPLEAQTDTLLRLTLTANDATSASLTLSALSGELEDRQTVTYHIDHAQLELGGTLVDGDEPLQPHSPYHWEGRVTNLGQATAQDVQLTLEETGEQSDVTDLAPGETLTHSFAVTTGAEGDTLTMTMTASHPCGPLTTTDSYTVGADSVNIADVEKDSGCRIFPNPAGDWVMLQTGSEAVKIEIYDLRGALLDTLHGEKTSLIQYNAQALRCGIYSVLFRSERRQEVGRLIIMR